MGCKFIREYLKVFAQNADLPRARLPNTSALGKAVGAWVVGCGYGCMPHLEYTCPRLGACRRPPAPGQSSSSSSSLSLKREHNVGGKHLWQLCGGVRGYGMVVMHA